MSLALDLLLIFRARRTSIECLVKEVIKVGKGVERFVDEARKRHLGESY